MRRSVFFLLAGCLIAALTAGGRTTASPQAAATGSIKGRVRLTGKPPSNLIIRMGLDPKCSQLYKDKRPVQESVVASPDGGLANVFVNLQGKFPFTPVPTAPVVIDQGDCVYHPRVVGARVGQDLEVRNSDALRHNVHGYSDG